MPSSCLSLSLGISNTHLSFESISSPGSAFFHTACRFEVSGGANTLCTMNLCLASRLGS
uniref:Uncharacterized protein n=1 Tax=Peromyscus maniculatus bairdii TaxID=230844 RepID=A0A8C8UBH5_PERMB